ncbi:MAG: GNAT family N-acetyltransferase [Gemmataceae bacterium]
MILQTARLILREQTEADAPAVFALGSDPAVVRYTHTGVLTSVDQALDILRTYPLADYRRYGYGRWACVLKETGAMIGFAGLKYLPELDEVDVGYQFLPAYWGVGLATEAGRAALEDGFTRLAMRRVIGLVAPENVASARVLTKLGLSPAGRVEYRGMTADRYVIERGRAGDGGGRGGVA